MGFAKSREKRLKKLKDQLVKFKDNSKLKNKIEQRILTLERTKK